MTTRIVVLFVALGFVSSCVSKSNNKRLDYYEKCRLLVLSEENNGTKFLFKRNGETVDDLVVIYLGDIRNSEGKLLRIVNSINYVGYLNETVKGNGDVFVYDEHNNRLGYFNIGNDWGLPSEIQHDCLIFSYNNDFCNQETQVCLRDSIPSKIFISCTEEGGDLYPFFKD